MVTDRTMFIADSNYISSICFVPRVYMSLKISLYRKTITISDMYLSDTVNPASSPGTHTLNIKLVATYKRHSA